MPTTLPSATQTRLSSTGYQSSTASTPNPQVTLQGSPTNDYRVRLSLAPGSPSIYYKDSNNTLLAPLAITNGVLFPLQPSVDIGFTSTYNPITPTHSNFGYYGYQYTTMSPISFTTEFPVRTPFEGTYVLAAITFLRACALMFTGQDGTLAGSPPPVLMLTGMGFGGLDTIPVVLTSFVTTYPADVDYVTVGAPVGLGGTITYSKVPTSMNIQISCQPIFSRQFASNFSATLFGSGVDRLMGPYISLAPETVKISAGPEDQIATTPTNTNGGLLSTSATSDLISSTIPGA